MPTVITGLILAGWSIDNAELLAHRNWALATLIYTGLHAIFRGFSLVKEKSSPFYILLSLINLILIGITADFGGLVAFGFSFLV